MSRTGTGQPEWRLHFGYPTLRVERAGAPDRTIDLEAGDPFPALEQVADEAAQARARMIAVLPEHEIWRGRVLAASAARKIAANALGVGPDRVVLRLGRRGADGRRGVAAVSSATLAEARAFLARGGMTSARLTAAGGQAGFEAAPDFGRFALPDVSVHAAGAGAAAGFAAALALIVWLAPWGERAVETASEAVTAPAAAPVETAALPPAPAGFPDPTAPVRLAEAAAPAVELAALTPLARPAQLAVVAPKAVAQAPVRVAAAKPPAVRQAEVPAPTLILTSPVLAARNLPADLSPPAVAARSPALANVAPPRARPAAVGQAAATPAAQAARAVAAPAALRSQGAPLPRPGGTSAAPAAVATPAAAVAPARSAAVAPDGPRPRPERAPALSREALAVRVDAALAEAALDMTPRARPVAGAPTAQPGAVRVASLVPTGSVLNDFSAAAPAMAAVAPPEPRRAPAAAARPAVAAAPAPKSVAPRSEVATPRLVGTQRPVASPARVARLDPAPQPVIRAAAPRSEQVVRAAPVRPVANPVQRSQTVARATPAATPAVSTAALAPKPVATPAPKLVRTQPAAASATRFQQPAAPTTRAAVAKPAVQRQAAAKPAVQRQAAVKPQRVASAERTQRKPAASQAKLGRNSLTLVGVFGGAKGRHALVQLPNGSTEKVKAGDTLGGVQITSITADAVHLSNRGRDQVLTLPR